MRVADQQRVQREQELDLLIGDVLDVGHVPRADHRAVRSPELHPPRARDQRQQRVVVPGAARRAAIVGGAGAVGDVDPPALREEPQRQQDAGRRSCRRRPCRRSASAWSRTAGRTGRGARACRPGRRCRGSARPGSRTGSRSARRSARCCAARSGASRGRRSTPIGSVEVNPCERQVPAAEHARVGQRVKVRAGLLDGPLEALDVAAGVAQRAVDPDRVDGRADLAASSASIAAASCERLFLV